MFDHFRAPRARAPEPDAKRRNGSALTLRNVTVAGHRTSMRLEPVMWDALAEICRRERRAIHDICTMVNGRRGHSSLTSAVRAYIVDYFRAASERLESLGGRVE